MMTVKEYANDTNHTVAEILKKCEELGIKVKSGDSTVEMPVITNKWLGTMDENISYTTKEQETIDAEANARPTSASELNKVATEGFNLDMDLDKAHEEISKDDILDLGL